MYKIWTTVLTPDPKLLRKTLSIAVDNLSEKPLALHFSVVSRIQCLLIESGSTHTETVTSVRDQLFLLPLPPRELPESTHIAFDFCGNRVAPLSEREMYHREGRYKGLVDEPALACSSLVLHETQPLVALGV